MERIRLWLWTPGVLGRPTRRGPTPPVVRIGGHEVRDPQAREGQAAPRLRGDEGAGRADARLLFAVAGDGLPDPAVARGRGARCREGRRGKEGLRDHRRGAQVRSEEHTSEFQSPVHLVCRLLLEKKKIRHKAETTRRYIID